MIYSPFVKRNYIRRDSPWQHKCEISNMHEPWRTLPFELLARCSPPAAASASSKWRLSAAAAEHGDDEQRDRTDCGASDLKNQTGPAAGRRGALRRRGAAAIETFERPPLGASAWGERDNLATIGRFHEDACGIGSLRFPVLGRVNSPRVVVARSSDGASARPPSSTACYRAGRAAPDVRPVASFKYR